MTIICDFGGPSVHCRFSDSPELFVYTGRSMLITSAVAVTPRLPMLCDPLDKSCVRHSAEGVPDGVVTGAAGWGRGCGREKRACSFYSLLAVGVEKMPARFVVALFATTASALGWHEIFDSFTLICNLGSVFGYLCGCMRICLTEEIGDRSELLRLCSC